MATDSEARDLELDMLLKQVGNYPYPTVFQNVMNWHKRYSPRKVSREEVRQVLIDNRANSVADNHALCDALAALLNGEPEKKWCEHLKHTPQDGGWYFRLENTNRGFLVTPLDGWNLCPICGAKRPEGA